MACQQAQHLADGLGLLFCILPWMAVGGAMSYWLVQPGHDRVVVMLVTVVIGVLWIPAGMISVGMLSLAYRHFFERRIVA